MLAVKSRSNREVAVSWFQTRSVGWRYALSSGSVLALTLLLLPLPDALKQTDIALLYLLVVLISATTFGLGPAIVASLLAFLCSNFFFVSPRYTLAVNSPEDLLRLVVFLIVAISTSSLAGRVRHEATVAQARSQELTTLYTLSQAISAEVDLDRILPVIAQTTCALLDLPMCQILLYDARGIKAVRASYGSAPAEARPVDSVLRVGARALGALRITQRPGANALTATERKRLDLIASQIVLVIERAQLVEEVGNTRSLAESDRLKSVLLASVSHDLRTPLAVIKAATTSLLDDDVLWDGPARRDLLQTMDEETDRLNRLVGNLLEMSRIEAGALPQTRSLQDLGELLELVLARLEHVLAGHPLHVAIAPDLPLVLINATQIDQVLTNLLENAARHTPPHTPIDITVDVAGAAIRLTVRDYGAGIPEAMAEHIFERFVRAAGPERHAEGSGLGLAIARGLALAHGGQLWASNVPGGGAEFVLKLPIAAPTVVFSGTPALPQIEEQRS